LLHKLRCNTPLAHFPREIITSGKVSVSLVARLPNKKRNKKRNNVDKNVILRRFRPSIVAVEKQ